MDLSGINPLELMAILPGYDIDEVSAADSSDHSLQMCTCLDIYLPGTSSSSSYCSVHSSSNSDASPPSDGSEPQEKNLDSTCSESVKNVATKCNMKMHTNTHTGIQVFTCQKCGREFETKHHRDKHMKLNVCGEIHPCQICSETFNSLSSLRLHVRSHTGEKLFSCGICGKGFNRKSNLNKHLKVHRGDKPFLCEICGKEFSQKCNLESHSQLHTGEKPYSCSICDMNFTRKRNRDRHVKAHSKDFACRICGKKIESKLDLEMHSNGHARQQENRDSAITGLGRSGTVDENGEMIRSQDNRRVNPGSSNQPESHNDQAIWEPLLVCPFCDKEFSSSRALFRHVENRPCLRSFICPVCDMIFKRKDNLKLHESIHRNGHSNPCPTCGKCYNRGKNAEHICLCSMIRDDSSANVDTGTTTDQNEQHHHQGYEDSSQESGTSTSGPGNPVSINVLSRVLETDPDVTSCNTETRTQLESIIEDICSSFYKECGLSMNNNKNFESK
ncbi:hypothetical protein QAD02_010870 [Eretmocerus hayati]|uniref:Uncharacterized protein n=1 Tax=Eretmocerus hayati TaxID=131215 RepID=A0ACC2NV09_9HYME|nr:hypothetical protein QAD02_010870 [Eretmocerus hayati]